ncbi:MAG: STAS domain-containing protein [Solirubrobacteraceae bacterium]
MEGSTENGLLGDAAGDRIIDPGDHGPVRTDLEVGAAARVAAPSPGLDVRRVDHPLGVVLTLGGDLDLSTVPVLQGRLDQAMRTKAAMVIDLSRLRFMDSSGLGLLVRAERQLRDSGLQLVLVRGPRAVHRIFEFTSLDCHFEFCDSPSAALRTTLVRRIAAPRIPQPPRTDRRPRPSSTANSREGRSS